MSDFELFPGEKLITLKKVIETVLEIILIVAAVVGLLALVWGAWFTLRVCITIIIAIFLGIACWVAIKKEEK